jgi:hypothetical protein
LLRLKRKQRERTLRNGMERRIRNLSKTRLRSRKWPKMNSSFLKKTQISLLAKLLETIKTVLDGKGLRTWTMTSLNQKKLRYSMMVQVPAISSRVV